MKHHPHRCYRSLQASSIVLAARSAPELCFVALAFRKRGGRRADRRGSPSVSRVLSDTWRPSARRLDVFRRRPRFRRAPSVAHAPSASSWRGGPSAPRHSSLPCANCVNLFARARRRPGACSCSSTPAGADPIPTSRSNRFMPLKRDQAGMGIWSYRTEVKRKKEKILDGIDVSLWARRQCHGTSGGHR